MRIAWGRSLFYFLMVAAIGFGVSHFTDAQRDSQGNVTKAGMQTFDQLQVGDCIEQTGSDKADTSSIGEGDSSFNVVPCSLPHIWEVFGLKDITANSYSDSKISDESNSYCHREFQSYTGSDPSFSSLTYEWYQPTKETWDSGDRLITCIAALDSKQMSTGSVQNFGG